jgi:hypothetical protein
MNSKNHLTYKGVFTPLPIRLLNAIARKSGPISTKPVSLEIRHLLETACGKTHLEDWGHPSAREALEVLLESVHREGKLTYFGRFALRQFLIAKLCNRLRIIEALKRFPEITRQKIDRPVFITGWYRCGTTYLHNLLDQDVGPGYHFYKDQLKLLNWLSPGRRWVLKWPFHLWHLDSLIEAFPDATVIHLHRDPREALPSVCSLAALARSSFCESIDNEELGKFWLDYCEAGLQRGLTAREKADENQVIDIRYPDLKKNPLSVINQIQNTINLGESDAWTESIPANSKAREKKVPGRHHYALAQFGLDPYQIQERFSKYIEDYDLIHASGAWPPSTQPSHPQAPVR